MPTTPLGLVYPDDTDPVTGPSANGATQMQALAESVEALIGLHHLYHGTSSAQSSFTLPDDTFDARQRHRVDVRVDPSTNVLVAARLRAGGSDDTGSGHYDGVRIINYGATGAVESNGMGTDRWGAIAAAGSGNPCFVTITLDGAALAAKTVVQMTSASWYNTTGNLALNNASRHSQATVYDAMTLWLDTGTADWVVDVYGL